MVAYPHSVHARPKIRWPIRNTLYTMFVVVVLQVPEKARPSAHAPQCAILAPKSDPVRRSSCAQDTCQAQYTPPSERSSGAWSHTQPLKLPGHLPAPFTRACSLLRGVGVAHSRLARVTEASRHRIVAATRAHSRWHRPLMNGQSSPARAAQTPPTRECPPLLRGAPPPPAFGGAALFFFPALGVKQ